MSIIRSVGSNGTEIGLLDDGIGSTATAFGGPRRLREARAVPTAALDPAMIGEVMEVMREVAAVGTTTVAVPPETGERPRALLPTIL